MGTRTCFLADGSLFHKESTEVAPYFAKTISVWEQSWGGWQACYNRNYTFSLSMKEEECIHCLHWNEDSGDLQPCRVDMLSEQEIDYCVVSQTHTHTQTKMYKWQDHHHFLRLQKEVVVVPLLSHVQLFANPWTAVCQASLSRKDTRKRNQLLESEFLPYEYLLTHLNLIKSEGFSRLSL